MDLGDLSKGSLKNRNKERVVDIKKIAANKQGNSMPSSKQGVLSKSLRRETALQPSMSRQVIAKGQETILVIHSNLVQLILQRR